MRKQELLARFIEFAPEFAEQWNSDSNCFRDKDGSYTYHGVCAEFSHFFRDNYSMISDETLDELFEFIEQHLVTTDKAENDLDNALCTCFLENISSEPCGEAAKPFMRAKARQFFNAWHTGPPY